MKKADLDRETALEAGGHLRDTSLITTIFLRKLLEAIASGEEVHLSGFGKFRLAKQGGAPPPHARFGGGDNESQGQATRYRVHFSKSTTLTRAVKRQQRRKHMEKYGVDESVDQKALEKAAASGCPECGAKCERHGNTLICPRHGTKPFEKQKENGG